MFRCSKTLIYIENGICLSVLDPDASRTGSCSQLDIVSYTIFSFAQQNYIKVVVVCGVCGLSVPFISI